LAQKLSCEITKLLSETDVEKEAKKLGFIKRKSKLSAWKFLDMLMFTHFNHEELSLNELAVQLKLRYGIEISKQGIDNKFTGAAVEFIKAIMQKAMKVIVDKETKLDFLGNFKRVRIKDSTAFQLPEDMKERYPGSGGAASKAMIRIQFEYDLKTGEILDLSLHPFNAQDTSNAIQTIGSVEPDELIIRDLGYINFTSLHQIQKIRAYFINRLQYGLNVYEQKQGKLVRLDFSAIEQYLKKTNQAYVERVVYIDEKEKLEVRLIIELLPDKKKQERLSKANKEARKKGRNLGDDFKSRVGLNLFITNIDQQCINACQVRQLYTLRWQIELIFKVWKSIGEIHKTKKMKIDRFESYLFAKLLWIIINWKIFWKITVFFNQQKRILMSIIKMFRTFKNRIESFRASIIKGKASLTGYIMDIVNMAEKHYRIEQKRSKLSLYNLIKEYK
jgi:hypothetical protein